MAELLYSARNANSFAKWRLDLSSLLYLRMTPEAERHLVDVMAALALRGQHRTPIPDLMLAAVAHAHRAVVLHYDSDYERIAEVTGQPQEWILPRGTGHGVKRP
jgi:predicted nucleic acid-binding protein